MKSILWKVLNFFQVSFFLYWSVVWQTIALVLRIVTMSQTIPLMFANYIWAPVLVGITGSKIEVQGLEDIDIDKPHVYVFCHQSTLDIAVAFCAIRRPIRFIAKRELLYVPFLGWYVWAMGMIMINRGRSEKAIATLRKAGEVIRNGASVFAFPEGTRTHDGSVLPFKKGAFVVAIEAGVPVVPVAIQGTHEIMPKNTFRLRPHPVTVKFGDPIPTKDLTYEDRERLMQTARNHVIDLHLSIGGKGGEKVEIENPVPNRPTLAVQGTEVRDRAVSVAHNVSS